MVYASPHPPSPATKAVLEIGYQTDEHDSEKSQDADRHKRGRHLEAVRFQIDEVAKSFRGHEKLGHNSADNGAADACAQTGQYIGYR